VDHSEELLSTLSMCTGSRGLDRGVERVVGQLRTITYVEIEAALVENLVVGMEKGKLAPAPIWTNAKTVPWRYFRGKVFFMLGGYPCQPFSTAGKRRGRNDPRHLWPHFERGIRTVRPVCVYFENVLGHLSLGFDQVTESLHAMGYAVEAGIFTAAEVGAPHKRARVFILGILADAKDYVRRLYERQWRYGEAQIDAAGSGENVAYTFGDGARTDAGRAVHPGSEIEGAQQREERDKIFGQRNRSDFGNSRADISAGVGQADSGSPGLAQWSQQPAWQECPTAQRSGHIDRWPAGPGESQYDWEEPRTLEPGMGLSADGYDFREDLLRALGNGVIEQQAAFALRRLLAKHFE